jgi:hypothetical protein
MLFRKVGKPARLVPIPEIVDVRVDINEEIDEDIVVTVLYILLTFELIELMLSLILLITDDTVEEMVEGKFAIVLDMFDTTVEILLILLIMLDILFLIPTT